jgi:hypothetical protein
VFLGARGNAFVASMGVDGRRDMSSANLRKTRDYPSKNHTVVPAPFLQFPADTLPSLHPGKCFKARDSIRNCCSVAAWGTAIKCLRRGDIKNSIKKYWLSELLQ